MRRGSARRVIVGVLLGLGLMYVLGVGLLAAWQRHIVFPGAFLKAVPRLARAPADTVEATVTTADGERLHALWKAPRTGCGVVVTFHGNASFPETMAARFAADPWARDGWGLLAIAYRGYPGSTGAPSEDGLITDGLAAYAEAHRRAPQSPILLHGHSLGAAIAIAVATRTDGYAGLYLEAPFASLLRLAEMRQPFVPVSWLLRDPMRSDERIGHVHGPVVIVHGTGDGIVPVEEGRRLAAAAPSGTVFDAIAGDHMSIVGARDRAYEPVFRGRCGGGADEPGSRSATDP